MNAPRSLLARIFDTSALRAAQILVVGWLFLRPSLAIGQPAGGGGMPWEGPLQQLIDSLTGPVAKGIGIAAIVCLGIGIAFSEGGSMLRKALFVVFGLALTFSAATWALPFLGFSK
jgi:type IV secretion system protein VirB2